MLEDYINLEDFQNALLEMKRQKLALWEYLKINGQAQVQDNKMMEYFTTLDTMIRFDPRNGVGIMA